VLDEKGRILSSALGTFMEMRLEDKATAMQLRRSTDLFDLGSVRIARSLGAAGSVRELHLLVSGAGAGRVPDTSWQRVERREDGSHLLRIGRGLGIEERATKEEIAEASKETIEFPISDPRIKQLAADAVSGAKDDRSKARQLVFFVKGYVEDEIADTEAFSALEVIQNAKGDCTEHALLLTALARAAGIPARTVSGLMYMGDKERRFGGHAWNELLIDGKWLPVDAVWGQLGVDATHISFGHGDEGGSTHAETIGALRFKVLSVQADELEDD